MESDVAVEGALYFAESKQHRLGTLVGDGDCHINHHLNTKLPNDLQNINRAYDVNHVIKNFTKKLYTFQIYWKKTRAKLTNKIIMVFSF
jgi:hypothetical protein